MRRAHAGHATRTERAILARTTPVTTPPAAPHPSSEHQQRPSDETTTLEDADTDSLDDLDEDQPEDTSDSPARPYTGLGLYDPHTEALTW